MTFNKLFPLLVVLFVFTISFSQERRTAEFGKPTNQELAMSSFEKDPEAAGVVLFEKGKNYVKIASSYVYLYKEVHKKIKVIDAKKFKNSQVEIYLYRSKNDREKISKLKAITHNGRIQTYVNSDAFYDIDESTNWYVRKFTFPNVKDGSILEYSYTIRTPFFFNFGGWDFQGDLPKIYSEFNSVLPGNFVYNRVVFGKKELFINEAKVEKGCFSFPFSKKPADCEVALYAMKDIPAYKEESYMLSKKNYMSRVSYELMTYHDSRGLTHKYSKTWKDVDKGFKHDKDTGRQLNYNSYFKSELPESILTLSDDLEKAKAIYTYIQNHFNWDGNSGIFSSSRVKKAFERRSGSGSEINLSLINALQAADLDAKLVLHSTRKNGLPALSYPVISDFNYVLAFLSINETDYLLDATDKFIPFGIVPFRALNIRGRVMDFKKGSYWHSIQPHKKNINYIMAQLTLDENETLKGDVNEIHTGYMAINKRRELKNNSENEYLKNKETSLNGLEINDYQVENKDDLEERLSEKYSIVSNPEFIGEKIYLYPYLLQNYFTQNPFKSNTRQFPINLGYPRTNMYTLTIDLMGAYEVLELPKSKKIILLEGAGECVVLYGFKNGKINLRFSFNLNETYFSSNEYQDLKTFYNNVIEIQTKQPIVLKKL